MPLAGHMAPHTLLHVLISVVFLVPSAHCMCYYPNGSAVANWSSSSQYQPCSSNSSSPLSSICCATNRSNPSGGYAKNGLAADICLPSGLCQNILTQSDGSVSYSYWRDYCTVQDWQSGKCLNVCTAASDSPSQDGTAPLTPCGDSATATKWCCGTNNTQCCSSNDSSQYVSIAATLTFPSSTSTSSSSATSTSTSTSSPSASPSQSSSSSSNSGLSTGAKAGIGVGAAIGGALVIAGLIFFALRRRRNTSNGEGKEEPYQYQYQQAEATSPPGYDGPYDHHHEVSDGGAIMEMSGEGLSTGKTDAIKYRKERTEPVELA